MIGICMDINSCVGAAIASLNCTDSNFATCCVPERDKAPIEVESKHISKELFLNISGNTTRNDAIYRYFAESLKLANITSGYQIAAYLSQIIDETDYFKKIETIIKENDINYLLGNNQTGDETRFRGRGGILLRGRKNYELVHNANSSKSFFLMKYLVDYERISFKVFHLYILRLIQFACVYELLCRYDIRFHQTL